MVPKRAFVVDALPRTPNGKVSRKSVAEQYRELLATVGSR
jgi:acyl-CoA synthetase (AMP-forming)/AMP-acid ligase II